MGLNLIFYIQSLNAQNLYNTVHRFDSNIKIIENDYIIVNEDRAHTLFCAVVFDIIGCTFFRKGHGNCIGSGLNSYLRSNVQELVVMI